MHLGKRKIGLWPTRSKSFDSRWVAAITYNTDDGEIIEHFGLEELDEIAAIVEHGPDWNTIGAITITLNHRTHPSSTAVEQTVQAGRSPWAA
jgi:hypothetical protein